MMDRYTEVVELVRKNRRPSCSFVQRTMHIGYNEAARYMDRMENDGLISKPNRVGLRTWIEGKA